MDDQLKQPKSQRPAKRVNQLRVWSLYALGLAILVLGFAIGSGTTIYVLQYLKSQKPGEMPPYFIKAMEKKLNLTVEQVPQFEAIYRKHIEAFNKIRTEQIRLLIEPQMKKMWEELGEVLNKKQLKQLREHSRKRSNRFFGQGRRRGKEHDRGPGPRRHRGPGGPPNGRGPRRPGPFPGNTDIQPDPTE